MEVSRQLERDAEEWQESHKTEQHKKLAKECNAQKRHLQEHETLIAQNKQKEAEEKAADLERLQKRWDTQAAEREEKRAEVRRQQQERTDAEVAAGKARVELEMRRAEAREIAVAEYKASHTRAARERSITTPSPSALTSC